MYVFVGCGKQKRSEPCCAAMMYTGVYSAMTLRYARTLTDDAHIRILSAWYGLLRLTDVIEPYNNTLIRSSQRERKLWAVQVIQQAEAQGITKDTPIVMLAGDAYASWLCRYYKRVERPLDGLDMRIGKKMHLLKQLLNNNQK